MTRTQTWWDDRLPPRARVRFEHWRYDAVTGELVPDEAARRLRLRDPRRVATHGGMTVCRILLDGVEIAEGVAYVHPRDRYARQVGRTKSFGRAVGEYLHAHGIRDTDGAWLVDTYSFPLPLPARDWEGASAPWDT